tara:strand:+ start:131 stop:772 length:642 start_codon:yes stop_codon:yes gene_type:complete
MEHQHPLEAVVKHKEQVVVPLTLHTHHLFNLPVEVMEATPTKQPVNLVVQAVVVVLLTEILVVMETNHRCHHHKVILVEQRIRQVVLLILLVVVAEQVVLVVPPQVALLLDLGVMGPIMITEPVLISLMPVVAVVPDGMVQHEVMVEPVVVEMEEHMAILPVVVLDTLDPSIQVVGVVDLQVQKILEQLVALADLVLSLFVIQSSLLKFYLNI